MPADRAVLTALSVSFSGSLPLVGAASVSTIKCFVSKEGGNNSTAFAIMAAKSVCLLALMWEMLFKSALKSLLGGKTDLISLPKTTRPTSSFSWMARYARDMPAFLQVSIFLPFMLAEASSAMMSVTRPFPSRSEVIKSAGSSFLCDRRMARWTVRFMLRSL